MAQDSRKAPSCDSSGWYSLSAKDLPKASDEEFESGVAGAGEGEAHSQQHKQIAVSTGVPEPARLILEKERAGHGGEEEEEAP